jgi:hypothetical protein
MGNFAVPLGVNAGADGTIEIRNNGKDVLPFVVLFENRHGQTGYRIIRALSRSAKIDPPDLTGNAGLLRKDIEGELIELGLYAKEARAMTETWRDSWFEEGTRVFYIVPRAAVDSILPLTVSPAPAQTARVFVGRVEVLSPWVEKEIEAALAAGDVAVLRKWGRFLSPFVNQMSQRRGAPVQAQATRLFFESSYAKIQQEFDSPGCIQ